MNNRSGAPLSCSLALSALMAAAISLTLASPPVAAQTVNTTALSQSSKQAKEVQIEAADMQLLEDEKKSIWTGDVDARRGNVRLKSDKLVVHFDDVKQQDGTSKTEATFLNATGRVVIITKDQKITGKWAKLDVKANLLNVGGNVVVTQGKTIVKGKKLFVNLNTNVSKFSGGRVKGSFVPQQ